MRKQFARATMEGTRNRGCWRRLKYEGNKRQAGDGWEVRKIVLEAKVHNRLYCLRKRRRRRRRRIVIAMDYYISNVLYSDNTHEQVFTMRVSPCGWLNLFCPIILKIVTNSTEHTLSWDSDVAHKHLVNRYPIPFYDTRKLITVVKIAHQWVLAEPQKSCTYFPVLSTRLIFFPIWDDCIFHLRAFPVLLDLIIRTLFGKKEGTGTMKKT